jgi:hypothetical protein
MWHEYKFKKTYIFKKFIIFLINIVLFNIITIFQKIQKKNREREQPK